MDDIKSVNLSTVEELLRRFFILKTDEFKKNNYMGVIVDNGDPGKLGRCKIRVRNMMEDLLDKDLPWAIPNQTFVGSLQGNFVVPPIGAIVNVCFRNNDMNQIEYTTMVISSNDLPDERLEDYPDTIVSMKIDDGTYVSYNRKTHEWVMRHSAGVMITIDRNGDTIYDSVYSATGNLTVKCLTRILLDAPLIQFPEGRVAPNPNGGPFNCIPVDPLTGLPHSGNIEIRVGA